MATIQISTTVKTELLAQIKEHGYKVSELIKLGFLAKKNNPQLLERVKNSEKETETLQNSIKRLQARLVSEYNEREKLQQKVEKIEQGLKE